jgi:hypothetical protein
MAGVRNRARTKPAVSGHRWLRGTSNRYYTSYIPLSETTGDTTGLGDNFPFTSVKVTRSGGILNGYNSSYDYVNKPIDWVGNGYSTNHLSLPNSPSAAVLASQTLARTTPNRSSSESLSAILEAREAPKMIQDDRGKALTKLRKVIPPKALSGLGRLAKLNLITQFGILPLISDLETCLDFVRLVDGRVGEIDRLTSRGLRRTVDLYSDSNTVTTVNNSLSTADLTSLGGRIIKVTTYNIRGHVRWRPSYNYTLSDSQARTLARKVISGFRLDPTSLYEAMPWSWLIDYFSNLGDFVKVNRNVIPCIHDTPRIMYHLRTETSIPTYTNLGANRTLSPWFAVRDEKQRSLVPASLFAGLSFLTEAQTSILGSLAVRRL